MARGAQIREVSLYVYLVYQNKLYVEEWNSLLRNGSLLCIVDVLLIQFLCRGVTVWCSYVMCVGDSTPLMEAASGGFADIVKLLLDHGANVNATSRYRVQYNLLHKICTCNN